MSAIDSRAFRDTCGVFATGVNIITTHDGGQDHGMTANAFMSISLDPPLIAVSIARKARMLGKIQRSRRFAVSVLACGMDAIAWHFAGKSSDVAVDDIFERLDGMPVIRAAPAMFSATVYDDISAGDHTIIIGLVRAFSSRDEAEPLLFYKGRLGALEDMRSASANVLQVEAGLMW